MADRERERENKNDAERNTPKRNDSSDTQMKLK